MRKLLVVIDETGGSSRPLETDTTGFGIGAIIFPEPLQEALVRSAHSIAETVKKGDFKYKHVQKSTEARMGFINTLNTSHVRAYAFYTSEAGIAQEIDRLKKAGAHYGTPVSVGSTSSTEVLLDQFIGYMVPQLAEHAKTNGYVAELYWDKRTDLSLIEQKCNFYIDLCKRHPDFADVNEFMKFGGEAKGILGHISKLAGVLAGDIRQFFGFHGSRIWRYLDVEGLKQDIDPHIHNEPRTDPTKLMATVTESFGDSDPFTGSPDTVMLRAYYKSFLGHRDDTYRRHLISFGDPEGRLGILAIEHGKRWHIYQLPD